MRHSTEIYSVFGQIEAVAAEILIEAKKATRIDAVDIPSSAAVNEVGDPARFAIILPHRHLAEFNRLIRDLRA